MSGFKFRQTKSLAKIATSRKLADLMMPFGQRILESAKTDQNTYYRSLLQIHTNITKPKKSTNVPRISVVVGVRRDSKNTGISVEAKRGTLAKAIGSL